MKMFGQPVLLLVLCLVLIATGEVAAKRPARCPLPPQAPAAREVSCRCGTNCPNGGDCVSCGCAAPAVVPAVVPAPVVTYYVAPLAVPYAPAFRAATFPAASPCPGGVCLPGRR